MIRTAVIATLASLLSLSATKAAAQMPDYDNRRDVYVGAYAGRYVFPDALFNFSNLMKQPGNLSGTMWTAEVAYPLSKTWFLGIDYSKLHCSTNGPYLTPDAVQEAAQSGQILNNVDGHSRFVTRTIDVDFKKVWSLGHTRFSAFTEFGIGRGILRDYFNGVANLTVPGYGAVTQPAGDHGSNAIWAPVGGGGVSAHLLKNRSFGNLDAVIDARWDTGWMIRSGFQTRFAGRVIPDALKKIF